MFLKRFRKPPLAGKRLESFRPKDCYRLSRAKVSWNDCSDPYFVPDHQTVDALTDAAKSGVDVKIILAGTTDSSLAQYAGQYFYSELLKSGVKLYRRKNILLHAKTLVIDGVWSTVGSTNMDFWSFSINDEVNAVILNREFAMEMEKMFAADLAGSDEIVWEEWEKRSLLSKIREQLAHLLSRWL